MSSVTCSEGDNDGQQGRPHVTSAKPHAVLQGEQLAELPTFYTQDTPASANEMWQRLHGDPMFAVRPPPQCRLCPHSILFRMKDQHPLIGIKKSWCPGSNPQEICPSQVDTHYKQRELTAHKYPPPPPSRWMPIYSSGRNTTTRVKFQELPSNSSP